MYDETSKGSNMEETWEVAPPGGMKKFASIQQGRILRRQILIYGSSGLATVVAGVGGFQLLSANPNKGELIANIYCHEVMKNLEAYHKNQLENDLQQKISQHLEKCSHCKSYDEQHFG